MQNLENKLKEIVGQPVGDVSITRSSQSVLHMGGGYSHGLIRAEISFRCSAPLKEFKMGSVLVCEMMAEDSHEPHLGAIDISVFRKQYYFKAYLLKGKETDELFFACAKDFIPDLVAPQQHQTRIKFDTTT